MSQSVATGTHSSSGAVSPKKKKKEKSVFDRFQDRMKSDGGDQNQGPDPVLAKKWEKSKKKVDRMQAGNYGSCIAQKVVQMGPQQLGGHMNRLESPAKRGGPPGILNIR